MSVLSEHVEQTRPKAGTGLPVLPRVNLLPPEIAESIRFRRIQYGLGGGLLAAVGVVALLYVGAVAAVGEADAELETATARTTQLQSQTAQFSEVEAVYGRAADAQAMLVTAMGEEVRYSRFLNDLSLSVPENVWLKDVTFNQQSGTSPSAGTVPGLGTVSFTGMAFKHDDVATWLDVLAKQKGFADPYFTSSAREDRGARALITFASTVTLTADSLSGRYTEPQGG